MTLGCFQKSDWPRGSHRKALRGSSGKGVARSTEDGASRPGRRRGGGGGGGALCRRPRGRLGQVPVYPDRWAQHGSRCCPISGHWRGAEDGGAGGGLSLRTAGPCPAQSSTGRCRNTPAPRHVSWETRARARVQWLTQHHSEGTARLTSRSSSFSNITDTRLKIRRE